MQQHRNIGKAVAVFSATAALLVTACCLGSTQARYENHTQWQAVYAPQKQTLESDRLIPGGQTVLLRQWQATVGVSRMETISLSTDTGVIKGTLRCTSDTPEYLEASLDRTEVTVGTAGMQLQLTLTPTQAAQQLTQKKTVSVQVELLPEGQTEPAIWAVYRVDLLESQPIMQVQEEKITPVKLTVDTADAFAWSEKLAVQVKIPDQSDTLKLTMDDAAFPRGTRYIQDGNSFLLGDDMPITILASEESTILFDFSLLPQPQTGKISLQAQTMQGATVTGEGETTVATDRHAFAADFASVDPILTGNGNLTIPLSADTNGLAWRIEMLTETEEGIAYTQSDEQYYLVVTVSEDAENSRKLITISNESALAPAGTYRLTLERLQDDLVISSQQMEFFICY